MTADPGWLPIADAPRGMTEIIGMDAKGLIARTWYFAPSSRTQGWLRQGDRSDFWWEPKFFMPLPPPPSQEG